MLADAKELGRQAGEGADTVIKFRQRLLETAFVGKIDLAKDKHGPGRDDASVLTEAYFAAKSGATMYDHKSPNQRVNASKSRLVIRFAGWGKIPGQPLQIAGDFIADWRKSRNNPLNRKRLRDVDDAFLLFAREQMKKDYLIDAKDFRNYIMKPDTEQATEEDICTSIDKAVAKYEKGYKGVKMDSATATAIRKACKSRVAAIKKAAEAAATDTSQAA
jgi:hypothetical protein